MVVKVNSGEDPVSNKYNFTRKAGKNIVENKPTFSPDGESLVVIVENVVRVYNIQTADCVRTLETEQPIDKLISIHFPSDGFNLYGCSNKGNVTVWTWANGAVLREMALQLPPSVNEVLTFDLIDDNECFVVGTQTDTQHLFLASYSVKTGAISINYRNVSITKQNFLSVSLGVCDGDRYAAICNGTKAFYVQNLAQPHLKSQVNNYNQLRVVSVAAHPTENCIAITDTLGRVTLFKGYLFDHRNLAREVMHWHYLPALSSCFSQEGHYLYTAGMERVLVKWTLGNLARKAQEKQFIPRLPGIVKHVAVNNMHIAVALTNNSIVIASAQMRVLNTIVECGGLSPVARALGTSLVYHRPTSSLLLGGRTGHLQMFSTVTDKLVYNIDVTQMNCIPPTRQNLLPLELEVNCAAVSADGSWLVTSEYRNDDVMYPEERLKFWTAAEKGAVPFKLNTCVNLSHGGCKVVSIALSNSGEFCVTAGEDQKFRIWKRETVKEKKRKRHSWSCLTACYYSSGFAQSTAHEILNKFKNSEYNKPNKEDSQSYMHKNSKDDVIYKIMSINQDNRLVKKINDDVESEMSGVAISQDGSLIAAWFGSKLTLWDTHLCNLRTSLAHPVLRPKGLQVQFGNHDAAHYLVCTTEESLAVWSLLSLTMKWYVALRPSCLTADPFSNKMAVVTRDNDVIVFTPHSSKPVLKHEKLLERSSGVISQCSFGAPPGGDDSRLYFMRNDSEIYALEPQKTSSSELEVLSRRNIPASNFSALLAEQRLSEVKSAAPVGLENLDSVGLGRSAIAQFLSAAPHMMPPVSLLCTTFLEHISGREIPSEPADDVTTEQMEVDEQSSDDEEPEKTHTHAKKTELWTASYEHVKEKKLKKILKGAGVHTDVSIKLFGS